MSGSRTCGICSVAIDDAAPITLCSGCGRLYHDDCYGSPRDCRTPDCEARREANARVEGVPAEAAADGEVGGGGGEARVTSAERRKHSLERAFIPNRVKSGEFTEKGISLETQAGGVFVEWPRVEMLALGIVEEAFGDAQTQKSGVRAMVRKFFFGESQADQQRVRKIRDVYLLDIFVREQPQPFRVDGSTVNYRSFLGSQVSHSSSLNFRRFMTRLVQRSADACLDTSTVAFLNKQRERIRRCGAVYDFELDNAMNRERLHTLSKMSDLRAELEQRGVFAEEVAHETEETE